MEKRIISILLVGLLCLNMVGCSSNKPTAKAGINQKLELALKYLAEKQFNEAILTYNEVIKIDPKRIEAYQGLSLAYTLQNKIEKAKSSLAQGLKHVPDSVELNLSMAGLLVGQKQTDAAEAIYKNLLKAEYDIRNYQAYTRFLIEQKRASDAISLIKNAIGQHQNEYRLNALMAEVYMAAGQTDLAQAAAITSIDIQPNQSEAYKILNQVYLGRWQDWQLLGDQYLRLSEQSRQLMKLFALLQQGQYPAAITLYNAMPDELKNLPRTRLWLAYAQFKAGKKTEAEATLARITVSEIKDAGLLAEIAGLFMDLGDDKKARESAIAGIAADETMVDNYAILVELEKDLQKRIWEINWKMQSVETPVVAAAHLQTATEKKPPIVAKVPEATTGGLVIRDVDGDIGVYHGEIKNGKANGKGVLSYYKGDKFEGQFTDNQMNGQGTCTWANGEKYVGQWVNGQRTGQGTYTWTNGDKYVGHFDNSVLNGSGTMYRTDGTAESGIWRNNELISQ